MDDLAEQIKQQYLIAVMEVNPDLFFQLVEKHGFPDALLDDVGSEFIKLCCERRSESYRLFKDLKFPLYYITLCWKFVFDDYTRYFQEADWELVSQRKQKNDRIVRYFQEQHNLPMDHISFKDYWVLFDCYRPDSDLLFDGDATTMISQGYRKMDVELYMCVAKGWYDEAKQILEKGANPIVPFEDESDTSIELVKWKLDLNLMCLSPEILRKYDTDSIPLAVCELVGAAAWMKMYDLIRLQG